MKQGAESDNEKAQQELMMELRKAKEEISDLTDRHNKDSELILKKELEINKMEVKAVEDR